VADKFCDAKIFGFDLKGLSPTCVPPNSSFWVFDVESEWKLEEDIYGNLQLIHARDITLAIKNWPELLQQAFKLVLFAVLTFSCAYLD